MQRDVLWDYHHLVHVYLNPSKFIDTTGMEPEAAATRLDEIQRLAGRLVLPTERDTLTAAIQGLSKAMLASFAAKRSIVGIVPRQATGTRGGTLAEDDGRDASPPVPPLSVAGLRQVKEAMQLLAGNIQRENEPPRPPPPESLDDLVVRRDDPPEGGPPT